MFKLYFNYNGWENKGMYGKKGEKEIELRFFDELQAVQTMEALANKYHKYYFMLIENVYDFDDIKGCIRNEKEMYEYIKDFYTRLAEYNNVVYEDKTCLELKDEITKRYLYPKRYRHQ